MTINHLDLFSGIGGFSLALERAVPDRIGWTGYSDIDKYANQVFKRRFPNAEGLGSVTDVQPKDLPERIDLITFGSPCQDFSIAGKRGGISANRSSLFFEAMRIIRAKKPKYFVFENVKGLFSSGGGEDFAIVLREIADSGYDGGWELLNSRHYGVPQNRERIYFVGHLRGECRPKVFPLRKGKQQISKVSEQRIQQDKCHTNTLTARYEAGGAGSYIVENEQKGEGKEIEIADYRNDEGLRIRGDNNSPCLTASHNSEKELSRLPAIVIEREVRPVLTPDRAEKRQNGRRFKENGDDMFTLTAQDKHGVAIDSKIRRLTPVECSRLQGFPDDWNDCCSDSQRYKQMGNAITVNVAEEIFRKLYERT